MKNLLHYHYRAIDGTPMPSSDSYTGTYAEAVAKLRKDMELSVTPILSIEPETTPDRIPVLRKQYEDRLAETRPNSKMKRGLIWNLDWELKELKNLARRFKRQTQGQA